jgi:hypothetical protein
LLPLNAKATVAIAFATSAQSQASPATSDSKSSSKTVLQRERSRQHLGEVDRTSSRVDRFLYCGDRARLLAGSVLIEEVEQGAEERRKREVLHGL